MATGEWTQTGCGTGPVDLKICHRSKTRSIQVINCILFLKMYLSLLPKCFTWKGTVSCQELEIWIDIIRSWCGGSQTKWSLLSQKTETKGEVCPELITDLPTLLKLTNYHRLLCCIAILLKVCCEALGLFLPAKPHNTLKTMHFIDQLEFDSVFQRCVSNFAPGLCLWVLRNTWIILIFIYPATLQLLICLTGSGS